MKCVCFLGPYDCSVLCKVKGDFCFSSSLYMTQYMSKQTKQTVCIVNPSILYMYLHEGAKRPHLQFTCTANNPDMTRWVARSRRYKTILHIQLN